jgi:formate hydrogenlyase transcriptional activator
VKLEALQHVALRIAAERSAESVLRHIVDGLIQQPGVALARVWVTRPGDVCAACHMRPRCANQTTCLHLAASAGSSLAGEPWARTDGHFRRIPIDALKVGAIAPGGAGLLLTDSSSHLWEHPTWVRDQHIQSFAGQPLTYQDETLGVLAIFRREPIDQEEFRWLRMFADQAAAALASARAFSELIQANERVRQNERELRLLIDSLPQSVGAIRADGHVYYVNKAGLQYLGRTLDELTSAEDQLEAVYSPDDVDTARATIGDALRRGVPCELEARLRRHDGEYRWHQVRYEPVRDDEQRVVRWYGTGVDIDERKRSEERLRTENVALREAIDDVSMFEEIVGTSSALRTVLAHVSKVAPTDSTVLITGETGTGKELIARAIHKRSRRSSRSFVSVNCAAIPVSLIVSELFGHEKGAFTGAVEQRIGRFEQAEGGTIFLDEVGDLPPETQVSLLRVIQEREFERLGGRRAIRADVRIIAATNRDLRTAVDSGAVRSDLFYRLNVFPIGMPPLRERREDIPLLVQYFVSRFARKVGKRFATIDATSLALLQAYGWPGNIRELQNVLERAVIVADAEGVSIDASWFHREPAAAPVALPDQLSLQERILIEAALRETQGRVSGRSGAAAKLKMASTTLDSRIKALGIDKNAFKRVY